MSDRTANSLVLSVEKLDMLIGMLRTDGYTVVGPTLGEGAIIYDEISSTSDLPIGWTDVQKPGSYSLKRRSDDALFGYNVGPHSWKRFLFPANLKLWSSTRSDDGSVLFEEAKNVAPKYAFLGVRACEIAAIGIQDRVFTGGVAKDTDYTRRREQALFIGVNCGQAAETCFCVSMGSGPEIRSGYDLVLTELSDSAPKSFITKAGSEAGEQLIEKLALLEADSNQLKAERAIIEKTASSMVRSIDNEGIKETLYAAREHPRWEEVASRCLSCGNCTMVCPTCFCTSVTETSDLEMKSSEHHREWDSCFSMDFTYAAGGVVRDSVSSRYRQWMTHKLGSWFDQFGTSGCVGCGRCIAWCPVGIDITEEMAALKLPARGKEPGE